MNLFEQANDTLLRDLTAYTEALRTVVAALPRARILSDHVVKETRLIQALLEFAEGPHVAGVAQVAFQISNRWPGRELPYPRTQGFADEIAEVRRYRVAALEALNSLRRIGGELSREVSTCFTKIVAYLDEEQQLLADYHACIAPHATHMAMISKQVTLLQAAAAARLPSSAEQQALLHAYGEVGGVLKEWESGVPIDECGVAMLNHCLTILAQAGTTSFMRLGSSPFQETVIYRPALA